MKINRALKERFKASMQLRTSCDFSVSHRNYIKNDYILPKGKEHHWCHIEIIISLKEMYFKWEI